MEERKSIDTVEPFSGDIIAQEPAYQKAVKQLEVIAVIETYVLDPLKNRSPYNAFNIPEKTEHINFEIGSMNITVTAVPKRKQISFENIAKDMKRYVWSRKHAVELGISMRDVYVDGNYVRMDIDRLVDDFKMMVIAEDQPSISQTVKFPTITEEIKTVPLLDTYRENEESVRNYAKIAIIKKSLEEFVKAYEKKAKEQTPGFAKFAPPIIEVTKEYGIEINEISECRTDWEQFVKRLVHVPSRKKIDVEHQRGELEIIADKNILLADKKRQFRDTYELKTLDNGLLVIGLNSIQYRMMYLEKNLRFSKPEVSVETERIA